MTQLFRSIPVILFLSLIAIAKPSTAAPPEVQIAVAGKASLPIVVATNASKSVRTTAQTLADYLGKISGGTFAVQEGDGSSGIVVGLPADFAKLPVKVEFPTGEFERETYRLLSGKAGVWLLGATDLAVQHAAWDLLERLGYRQFFPGPTWEVVPNSPTLKISVDTTERPDIYARRIWYNWGSTDYNRGPQANWNARNRMAQGFQLNSGHAYGDFIRSNKAEFDAHPEYYAMVKGVRKPDMESKMCISNPGLRKLIVDTAVKRVKAAAERTPPVNIDSISTDPSDGADWCECEDCLKIGSPSDRALLLANDVATGINALGLGNKYVGMYAYNRHAPPPGIKVHPKVVMSVATAFLTGGWSLDGIIDGWVDKGASPFGIYDYFSVMEWDWNLPRAAKTARPKDIANTIRNFYNKGARFYDCESGDAWGPYGLGYYVSSRVMWDVDNADKVDALVDDFLTRSFGPAKEPMRRFYDLIGVDNERRSMGDVIARMYRPLAEARELAKDRPDVMARINDLILYTRYVEMQNNYASVTGAAQQQARDAMLTYTYRMRKTSMVHYYSLWARLVSQAAEAKPDHPLKNEEPITAQEIDTFLKNGIANNQPVEMGFKGVNFSNDLVPATSLNLPEVPPGKFPDAPQDRQTFYIWTPKANTDIDLTVTVKRRWANRMPKVSLYSPQETFGKPVAESEAMKPDGLPYKIKLSTIYDGLHRAEFVDGGDHTFIDWPKDMPVTLPSALDSPSVSSHFRGAWSLYFYVPKGTKVVGGWAARIAQWAPRISGTLKDANGTVQLDFSKLEAGWFHVAVPAGQDGKLWKFEDTQGTRQLMTVPPLLARDGKELLLPKEVVAADSK